MQKKAIDIDAVDKDFLLNHCDEAIIKTDSKKNISYVNKSTNMMFGLSLEDAKGEHFMKIGFPPTLLRQWANALNIIYDLAQEEIFEFACNLNNDRRHFNFKLFPEVRNGAVQNVVTYISDVSKWKQLESELEKQSTELEKIHQEMDHLVYHVSHDLRGPLSSLLGLIALAKEEESIQKLHEYIGMEEKSILKLNTYTEEIIQLSRNNRMPLESNPIDFEKLVADVFDELDYMYRDDPIVKVIAVSQHELYHSDEIRVKNILKNLLNNAIKFRKPQQQHVKVKVQIQVEAGQATISIKDNGQGISPDHMEKIFEMYYKGTAYKAGAGLGLYVVKDCVERLKGAIQVYSVVNSGSEFKVTLPQVEKRYLSAFSQNKGEVLSTAKIINIDTRKLF